MVETSSVEGMTSSSCQPFVVPTSHELDEPHDVFGPAEVVRQVEQRRVVHALADDGVDLDLLEPGRNRCVDAIEDKRHGEVHVVHLAERLVVQRIEADGDAIEASGSQILGLRRQQGRVRRQRDLDVIDALEHRHELRKLGAKQRLAAGEPHLARAEASEDASEAGDLLEGQDLVAAGGTQSRGRRFPSACSTGSGSCSGQ